MKLKHEAKHTIFFLAIKASTILIKILVFNLKMTLKQMHYYIFVSILFLFIEFVTADQMSNSTLNNRTNNNNNNSLTQLSIDSITAVNGILVTTDLPLDSPTEIDPMEYCNQTFQIRKGSKKQIRKERMNCFSFLVLHLQKNSLNSISREQFQTKKMKQLK